jgi:hypothetical protein
VARPVVGKKRGLRRMGRHRAPCIGERIIDWQSALAPFLAISQTCMRCSNCGRALFDRKLAMEATIAGRPEHARP